VKGIKIPGFKLTKDGKIAEDTAAKEAKLDVSTRIKRRSSKKVKVSRNPRQPAG
jgi:hypothetical protein